MCGRFTLTANKKALKDAFGLSFDMLENFGPRYNIAPSQNILALYNDGGLRAGYFRWGLIPHWAKDPKIGYKMINARAETLAQKPSFKGPLKKNRCLVLADGFYEWLRVSGKKIPQYIRFKDKKPFAFAGLWDQWKEPNGNRTQSCTIITTQANALILPIHARMPVILDKSSQKVWLQEQRVTVDDCLALLKPLDEKGMETFVVTAEVNSPKNDSAKLIEKVNKA